MNEAVADSFDEAEAFENFLKPENNAVIRSFQAAQGRGLAGVITSFSLDYADFPWGTAADGENLRAPKGVNININFSPIHDMPLGLNHNGEMFAPTHPVGISSAKRNLEGHSRILGMESEKQTLIAAVEAKVKNAPSKDKITDPAKPKLF